MDYEELCEKLEISKEIIDNIAGEWEEINNIYLQSLFKNAKEKQEELKKDGLNIQIKDNKPPSPKNYRIEVEKQIKEKLCKFFEVMLRSDLLEAYLKMIKQLKNTESFRRFLKSAMIYTRMYKKLNEIEDKFIYLCAAVEAAKRYNTPSTDGPKSDFVNFFVGNLSEGSLELALSYFEVLGANKRFDEIEEIKENSKEHLFKYIYQKRSDFVHEGKLFPHSGENSEWLLDVYRPDWRNDPDWKVYVRFNMPFEILCGLYEEALLEEFKPREV